MWSTSPGLVRLRDLSSTDCWVGCPRPLLRAASELMKLRVLGLGGDEDGNVVVGIFPWRENILVGGERPRTSDIGFRALRRSRLQGVETSHAQYGRVLRQVHVERVDFLDAEVAEHERGTIGSDTHPTDPIPRYPLWNLESRYALNLAVSDTNTIDDRSVPIREVGDVHKFAIV